MSAEKFGMDANSFSTILKEVWDAEQRNLGAHFVVRPNTESHFQITATAEMDGNVKQITRLWSYAQLDSMHFPAVHLREKMDYMAFELFEALDQMTC